MPLVYQPRGDYVLIKINTKDKVGGIVVPQRSAEGKTYSVMAVGPKVEDLSVGEEVYIIGSQQNGDWSFIPGANDIIITREANVVLVKRELPE